ncbi:putative HAT dimerization domain, ribonuclease H-like domain-containing protein [Rosa chinensis]|uniref:Putative HAT dimerization domain, ribonuclease H-like domain-containing protein n=1 Tax=Rosa chinensis TaxID=74649 RepID=A0A2P6RNU1_ROSCH|nr:putative HAT dimerization domain, ribonuclease H-like domain-containing protein [Rosa chinensis]
MLSEDLPNETKRAIDVLNYIKEVDGCYPNAWIAYRILLTIPVTVASAERSFSKLKLIKSYLRSTMSQERLSGLAMISIEKDIVGKLDYVNLISTFASKNARRVIFQRYFEIEILFSFVMFEHLFWGLKFFPALSL